MDEFPLGANIAASHIGICTSDLERSTRFYTEALGFREEYSLEVGSEYDSLSELPGLKCRAAFFRQDGLRIELLLFSEVFGETERRSMNQLGLTHINFIVDDIEAVSARVAEFGGQVHHHTRVDTPNGRMVFCSDPDGVRIELFEKSA